MLNPIFLLSQDSQVPDSELQSCPRFEGLLVKAFVDRTDMRTSALIGNPMALELCVTCGECLDYRMLASRQEDGSNRP